MVFYFFLNKLMDTFDDLFETESYKYTRLINLK